MGASAVASSYSILYLVLVEKRSSVTKTREHNIKKRHRVKVISDSDSDVTSRSDVSRSRLNLSNSSNSSGSSSDGAAGRNTTTRTMTNALLRTTVAERNQIATTRKEAINVFAIKDMHLMLMAKLAAISTNV